MVLSARRSAAVPRRRFGGGVAAGALWIVHILFTIPSQRWFSYEKSIFVKKVTYFVKKLVQRKAQIAQVPHL
jgi:hypothetical protein